MTYHCNPATGKIGICRAASPESCPFGVENHATTKQEIQETADIINQELVSIERLKNAIYGGKTPEEKLNKLSEELDDTLEKIKKEKGLKGVVEALDSETNIIIFGDVENKHNHLDGIMKISGLDATRYGVNFQGAKDTDKIFYRMNSKYMSENAEYYNTVDLRNAMRHHSKTLRKMFENKGKKYREEYELEKERKNKHYERKEFNMQFQLDKTTIFSVEFYALGDGQAPYFATSADKLMRNKRDISQGGQCQDEVLFGEAKEFYEKWDKHHLKNLSEEDYQDLKRDIETLKDRYNYIEKEREVNDRKTDVGINWYEEVALSKLKPKKV